MKNTFDLENLMIGLFVMAIIFFLYHTISFSIETLLLIGGISIVILTAFFVGRFTVYLIKKLIKEEIPD